MTNQTFSITVLQTAAPIWNTAPNLVDIYGGNSVSIQLSATDPQNYPITYAANALNTINGYSLPAGLMFNASNATIYGTIVNPATTFAFDFTIDASNPYVTNSLTFYANVITVPAPIMQFANGSLGTAYGLSTCADTVLEMNFEGTNGSTSLTDNQGHAVNNTGLMISNTTSFAGTGSLYCDSNNYLLIYPNTNEFSFGAYDFTIEFSINFTSLNALYQKNTIIQQWAPGDLGWGIAYYNNSGQFSYFAGFTFFYSTDGVTSNFFSFPALIGINFVLNTWYSLAFVRSNGVLSLYINGVKFLYNNSFVTNPVSSAFFASQEPLIVGFDATVDGAGFNGYIDELRITNGYARYTNNYTPSPLPLISGGITNPFASFAGGAITYSIADGVLPSGITINTTTGFLSGIFSDVSTETTYSFNVVASYGDVSNSGSYSITVIPENAPVWNITNISLGTVLGGYPLTTQVQAQSANYPYVIYSLANSTTLPAGFTLNANTGVITGTSVNPPNRVDDEYTFNVNAFDGYLSNTFNGVYITIRYNAPPVFTLSANSIIGPWYGNVANTYVVIATDANNQSITFSGSMPAGLTISNTGVITGTIVQPSSPISNVAATITVTNGFISNTIPIFIQEVQSPFPQWITLSGLIGGAVANYTVVDLTLLANGATSYTLTAGSLPAGLIMNGTSGVISGIPYLTDTAGTYNFTIVASNGIIQNTRSFAYNIIANQPPNILTSGTLPSATGREPYSNTIAVVDPTGLHQTITVSLHSGTIPAGLTLYANGNIMGTITDVASETTSNFVVIASNTGGNTVSGTLSIPVYPYVSPRWNTVAGSLGSVVSGYPFSITLSATDSEGLSFVYVMANSTTLPAGLTLNSNTGVIVGNATTVSNTTTYTFNVGAQDAYGTTVQTFSITVDAVVAPSFINSGSLASIYPYSTVVEYYAANFSGTGNYLAYTLNNAMVTANSFCAEMWVSFPSSAAGALANTISITGDGLYYFEINVGSNLISVAAAGEYTLIQNTNISFTTSTWYHIAFMGQGTSSYLFVDGMSVGVGGSQAVWPARSVIIGPAEFFAYRVTNHTTVYPLSGFTPPTFGVPLTSNSNTQILLFNGSNTSTDSGPYNISTTVNGGALTYSAINSQIQIETTSPIGVTTYALANSTTLPASLILDTNYGFISGTILNPNITTTTNFVIEALNGYANSYQAYSITVDVVSPTFVNNGLLGTVNAYSTINPIYAANFANASTELALHMTNPIVAANDYCVETWVQFANAAALANNINLTGLGNDEFEIVLGTNSLNVSSWGITGIILSSNVAFTTGTWYHIACIGAGATTYFYVNGTKVASASSAGTFVLPFSIFGPAEYFGFRVTENTPVYSIAGFTPPTLGVPLTSNTNTQFLLFNGTNTATDQGLYNLSTTVTGSLTYNVIEYTLQVAATTPYGAITYALANSTTLPSALIMNTATGAITGTLANPGANTTYSFVVSAYNGGGSSSYQNYAITVDSIFPPNFITANTLSFNSNAVVSTNIVAVDPQGLPVSMTLSSGSLPTGLSFANGVITGTTAKLANVSTSTIVVQANNGIVTNTLSYAITVNAVAVPTWITANGASLGTVLGGYTFSNSVTATSPGYNVTYSLANSNTLPAGLSLNVSNGVITGTATNPNAVQNAISFNVAAFNGYTMSVEDFSIQVNYNIPPVFGIAANTVIGPWSGTVANTYTVTATDVNSQTLTFSASLPTGLTISNTGVISGTIPQPSTPVSNVAASITVTNGVNPNTIQVYIEELQTTFPPTFINSGSLGTANAAVAVDYMYGAVFSGTSNYLAYTLNNAMNNANSFCTEMWVSFPSSSAGSLANGIYLMGDGAGYLQIEVSTNNIGVSADLGPTYVSNSAVTFTTGTWYHIAYIGQSTSSYLFVNGVKVGNGSSGGVWPARSVIIGPAEYFGFRVTENTPVYSLSGFTPPTFGVPLTSNSNTQILLFNGSNTSLDTGPYNISISVNGGSLTYTPIAGQMQVRATTPYGTLAYSLANSTTLPASLIMNTTTGIITGTLTNPSANTTYNFVVEATNGFANAYQNYSITVDTLSPIFVNYGSLGTANAYSNVINTQMQVMATAPYGNITYSLANSTTLPSALTMNTTTGAITGILANPISNTTYSFVVEAVNAYGNAYQNYSITVDSIWPPNFITNTNLGTYNSNSVISTSIVAVDPQGFNVTYSFVSGALPVGCTFANGVIVGTTTELASTTIYSIGVQATNGFVANTLTYNITVNAVPTPTWTTANATSLGTVLGGYIFSNTISAVDSGFTVTYALANSTTLPAGLSLNTSNGAITGTATNPTTFQNAISFNVVAEVADFGGGYTTSLETFSIDVIYNQPPIINTPSGSLATIFGGFSVSEQITAYDPTGYNQTITYSLSNSTTLPAGLTLNSTSGLISGIATNPSSNTTTNFVVKANNSITSNTQTYSITVYDVVPPTWTTAANLGTVYQYQTISQNLVASDNNGLSLSYAISSGTLPSGLTMANTGQITGTISNTAATGIDSVTVVVSDSVSNTARTFNMNVASYVAPVWVTSGTIISGSSNAIVNTTVVATSVEGFSITYALSNGSTLPGTLTLANTGIIAGQLPITGGTYSFGIAASDGISSVIQTLSVYVVSSLPVWTTSSVPMATGLVAYTVTLVATNAPTYSIASGSLPAGLTLNATTGIISGTPSNVVGIGQYSVTIAATNGIGSANQTFTFVVTQNQTNYDPYSAGVVLLMPLTGNNGSNATSVFADVMGHTVTVVGSPIVNTAATYNGLNQTPAVYFPGNSYLTMPLGSEFVVNTNDFTIEWSALGSLSNNNMIYFGSSANTSIDSGIYVWNGNVYMTPYGSTSYAAVLSFTTPSITNAWYNFAIVKHSSTLTLFINGMVIATTTGSNVASLETPLYAVIGNANPTPTTVKNVRFTNGSARYLGAYTVPTSFLIPPTFNTPQNTLLGVLTTGVASSNITISANDPWGFGLTYSASGLPTGMSINTNTGIISGTPTGYSVDTTEISMTITIQDAYFNTQTRSFLISVLASPTVDVYGGNTVLLLHFDAANGSNTFVDAMGHTVTTFTGSPIISTTAPSGSGYPHGGSCLYLNGSSSIQIAPLGNEFEFGANDFTLECDFYTTSVSGWNTFFSNRYNSGYYNEGYYFGFQNSTTFTVYYCPVGTTSISTLNFTGTAITANTWYNIALVRHSGMLIIYINGVVWSAAQALPNIQPTPLNLVIGVDTWATNNYFTGYIDEVRVTNGYARYTGTYTVAQTSFANPIYWTYPTFAALSGVSNTAATFNLLPTEPYGATFSAFTVSGLPSGLSYASNGVVYGTMSAVTIDTNTQITVTANSAYSTSQKTFLLTNYVTPSVDPYASNVVMFMPFDGVNNSNATNALYNPSFVDRTGRSVVQAVGNPIITTGIGGRTSGALSIGGSALLMFANSASTFSFGSNDFTIEFSIYTTSNLNNWVIASWFTSTTQSWGIFFAPYLGLGYGGSAGTGQTNIWSGPSGSSTGAWEPTLNTWNQIAIVCKSGTLYFFANGTFLNSATVGGSFFPVSSMDIGGQSPTGTGPSGVYIAGFRITNGFARYMSGTTPTNYTPTEFPVPVEWGTSAGSLTTTPIIGGNAV